MKKVLNWLLILGVGGSLGILFATLERHGIVDVTGLNPLIGLSLVMLAFWVQIIIHEGGHLIWGKFAGFRLYSFRVAFLAIQDENGGLKLKFFKNLGYLGLCIMVPTQKEVPRKSFLLYFAGGLLANLVVFLGCAGLMMAGIFNGLFIAATAFFGLFFFVSNSIPYQTKTNLKTDGLHLYNTLKNNAAFKDNVQLFSLNALVMCGLRPADLTEKQLNLHEQSNDAGVKVSALLFNYYHWLDKKEYLKAFPFIQEIEEHLNGFPKAQLKEVQSEILFAYCFLQTDQEKALALYREISPRLDSDLSVSGLRVKAACELFIHGNAEKAKELVYKAQKVLDANFMKGLITMEEALLAELTSMTQTPQIRIAPEILPEVTA